MNRTKLLLCTTVIAQLCISGCKKTNDVAVVDDAGISFQLKSSGQTTGINQRLDGSVQWTLGYASPELIKLEAKQGTKEVEFKSKSTQKINLLAPLTNALGNITLPPGTYNEVEFKIRLSKNGNDAAVELNGVFTGVGITLPVKFVINDAFEVKAEKENVTVTAGSIDSALTTIDFTQLTNGITQSMLTAAQLTNGTLVISANANSNLYNIILNNLNRFHSFEFKHH